MAEAAQPNKATHVRRNNNRSNIFELSRAGSFPWRGSPIGTTPLQNRRKFVLVRTIVKIEYKKPAFLPTLRELVRCNQAFERYSAAHIRSLGLTPPQFDVIATLGNTDGMTCGELGEKTLITKGTLSGVLDRLAERGLLARHEDRNDARRTRVALTHAGEAVFAETFLPHLSYCERAFSRLSPSELKQLREGLEHLCNAFEKELRE
jgi:MarR family transcriptional regulator, 2-MHQ and catechol-resistance regulon repressor